MIHWCWELATGFVARVPLLPGLLAWLGCRVLEGGVAFALSLGYQRTFRGRAPAGRSR